MDALRLTYPAQQQGQHLLVETKPDALRRWLEALPYGDMKRTVPQVSQALASLNRTPLPASQRADLAAIFDHTYELISDYYRPRIVLRPRGQQFADRAEAEELELLTREMSFCYKLLINDTLAKRSFWSKDKPLARALNLAVHYLGLILLEHYESYSPVPVYIWRELNALFAYAEANKLHQVEAIPDHYKHCLATVEDSYVRTCLIALANPYQMDRGEHWEMQKFLAYWGGLARISDDTDEFARRNCFVLDLAGEGKPRYGITALEDPQDPKVRLLVTEELTKRIGQMLATLEEERKLPEPGFHRSFGVNEAAALLRRMQSHWDFRVERQAPRYPTISHLDVVFGLQTIHQVLYWQDPLSAGQPQNEREQAAALLAQGNSDKMRWSAVNASDGGICITQHQHSIAELRVGQLAALREYIDGRPGERWLLGVVRWLRGDKRKGSAIGLQYIRGDAQPVMIRARRGNRIETGAQTALLVSGEEMHGMSSPTLITPRGLYQDGRPLLLTIGSETLSVRARMRVESSPLIERFFYQVYVHDDVDDDDDNAGDENRITLDNVPLPGDH